MGLVLAIHQPNFLPWLGFFHKMAHCDLFVLLDAVQIGRGQANLANRVKIKTPGGVRWLTRPMHRGHYYRDTAWAGPGDAQWKTIQHVYGRAPYFHEYAFLFEGYVRYYDGESLAVTNTNFITNMRDMLGLETLLLRQSVIGFQTPYAHQSLMITDMCRYYGADTYLSGQGGRAYNDEGIMDEAGIQLVYQEFEHPVYEQLWGGEFKPGLTILDMLFNCGIEAVKEAVCAMQPC